MKAILYQTAVADNFQTFSTEPLELFLGWSLQLTPLGTRTGHLSLISISSNNRYISRGEGGDIQKTGGVYYNPE